MTLHHLLPDLIINTPSSLVYEDVWVRQLVLGGRRNNEGSSRVTAGGRCGGSGDSGRDRWRGRQAAEDLGQLGMEGIGLDACHYCLERVSEEGLGHLAPLLLLLLSTATLLRTLAQHLLQRFKGYLLLQGTL